MKNIVLAFAFIASSLFLSNCSDTSQGLDDSTQSGNIEFALNTNTSDFSTNSASSYDTLATSNKASIDDARFIQITIQNDTGINVVDEIFTLVTFGDSYLSLPISLEFGTYTVTKFLVLDINNTAIFGTPTKNSNLSSLVREGLDLEFTISSQTTKILSLDVLEVADNSPIDFGAISFTFDLIDYISFSVNAQILTEQGFEQTAYNLTITTEESNETTKTIYNNDENGSSTIYLKTDIENNNSIALVISKDGYGSYIKAYTLDELAQYGISKENGGKGALDVILTKSIDNSPTTKEAQEAREALDIAISALLYENNASEDNNSEYNNSIEELQNAIINFDTSKITDMSELFKYRSSFNLDISNWDVSNVTDMSNMFLDATSFNQPLNGWDVSNVTNMNSMFNRAKSFNQPLYNWDVSNVTVMWNTFDSATSFNQPLNSWNVSNVTVMWNTFENAINFNQPLNSWDVSNVTNHTRFSSGATSWIEAKPNFN